MTAQEQPRITHPGIVWWNRELDDFGKRLDAWEARIDAAIRATEQPEQGGKP